VGLLPTGLGFDSARIRKFQQEATQLIDIRWIPVALNHNPLVALTSQVDQLATTGTRNF
jgi:hypothetical protein